LFSECVQSRVDLESSLCLPSASIDNQPDGSPQSGFRKFGLGHPGLASIDLVPGSGTAQHRSLAGSSSDLVEDLPPRVGAHRFTDQEVPIDLVAAVRWATQQLGYSEAIQDLFVQSWRPSTIRSYQCAWRRW